MATVAGPGAGIAPRAIAALAVGVISAARAGMLYRCHLGRFSRVWAARGVFAALFPGIWCVFGAIFLSLL